MQDNDISQVFANAFGQAPGTLLRMPAIWLLLAVALVVAICWMPAVKGWLGEKLLSLWLRLFLDQASYRVIDELVDGGSRGHEPRLKHIREVPL